MNLDWLEAFLLQGVFQVVFKKVANSCAKFSLFEAMGYC